jgi:hypothetical protein
LSHFSVQKQCHFDSAKLPNRQMLLQKHQLL